MKPLLSSRTGSGAVSPAHVEATTSTTPVVPSIRRELRKDGSCVLTFDCPGTSANVLNTAVLNELDEHLSVLEVHEEIRLVVLRSAKPSIFIAGADLRALSGWIDAPAEIPSPGLSYLITLGQRVIQRLAALPMTT
ncbi:MAG TPA: hypothetical protein VK968_00780, partial [Roseimicrobium sp.]|nr:hypothetical protein [Roseimicrobium sp.]